MFQRMHNCTFVLEKQIVMRLKLHLQLFIAVSAFVIFTATNLKAQTYDYTVDWNDTSTYHVSCGKVITSQWSVKDDSCAMNTPYLRVEATQGAEVIYSFKVNQSGNGEITDRCYVFHSTDGGTWNLDTMFKAGGVPKVFPYKDSVLLGYSHFIQFKICMTSNSNNQFWAIKGGNITVTDGNSNKNNIVAYSSKPPAPS